MKKLLIYLLIISALLTGCGDAKDSKNPDNSEGVETPAETAETVEAKPAPDPESEDSEDNESESPVTEPVKEVTEPEEAEIPESDRDTDTHDTHKTVIYETNEYCIYEYELSDGMLIVKADDGVNVSSSFGSCQPFEFSYPVSDDCVWQEGGHGYGPDAEDGSWDVTPESIEEEIHQVREIYDTEPDWVESPAGIQFRIVDDVVIAVYTSKA